MANTKDGISAFVEDRNLVILEDLSYKSALGHSGRSFCFPQIWEDGVILGCRSARLQDTGSVSSVRDTVYCRSPLAGVRCHTGELSPAPLASSPRFESFMPKRILVVDDNAPIRGLVREFIESRPGFEICGEATDGEEGIQKGR